MSSVFTVEKDGVIARICFDDEKLNVFTLALTQELQNIFEELEADEQIKSVILRGNIRTFSAGLDLQTMKNGGIEAELILDAMRKLLISLYTSRIRIICICTGHAVAAGALLLLVSDYRIGIRGAVKIGFSEVLFGLSVPKLSILLMKDRITVDQHFAASVLGKMYDSAEAQQAGFLDELAVDNQNAQDKANQVALQLAKISDATYIETLHNVRGPTVEKMS